MIAVDKKSTPKPLNTELTYAFPSLRNSGLKLMNLVHLFCLLQ